MENKIIKLKKIITLLFLIALCLSSNTVVEAKTNKPKQTEVSEYALKWDGHKEMPYVYSGPGGRTGPKTLEECSDQKVGFDCSAFTSMVYRHFGIEITPQSDAQKTEAYKVFTDESEAIPGDICWWGNSAQHVGIYIGDGKICHTNTSEPPTNYVHVDEFSHYGQPEAFLRMVKDVNDLKPLSGNKGNQVQDKVESTKGYGSIITESDLTGMPSLSTLKREQQELLLKGRENLSKDEIRTLSYCSNMIENSKDTPINWYNSLQSLLGMVCILYGILLIAFFIFDYANNFFEFSLLEIITFGKLKIVDLDSVRGGIVKSGFNKRKKVTYVTFPMIIARSLIVIFIGLMLTSGVLGDIIYSVWVKVVEWF